MALATYADMTQELADRGFDYLSATRRGNFITWAYQELDEAAQWPWRSNVTTGAAPLNYAGIGGGTIVDEVIDTTNKQALTPATMDDLLENFGDLSTAGTPQYWYADIVSSGTSQIKVYPAAAVNLQVIGYRQPTDPATSILMPTRWLRLVVDIAVRMAYRDADNHEAAAALAQQIENDKMNMLNALMFPATPNSVSGVQITEQW